MTRNSRSYTGSSLASILASRGATQTTLAEALSQSSAYVSQVARGQVTPSPQWLDLVADTLKLTPEERVKLHVAGAKDAHESREKAVGFKLDLSQDGD